MKTFIASPNTNVWNPEKNELLCKFDGNGVLSTDNKEIIGKLTKAGYQLAPTEAVAEEKPEGEAQTESDIKPDNVIPSEWNEIQKMASSLNIAVKGRNKEDILKDIEEKVK